MTTTQVDTAAMAARIGVTARRAQQLVGEGVLIRHPDGGFDPDVNARRYRVFADKDLDAACDDLQAAAEALDDVLDRLRRCRTNAARKKLAHDVGQVVGGFDAAMRLVGALAPPHVRDFMNRSIDRDTAEAIGNFFDLAGLQIAD